MTPALCDVHTHADCCDGQDSLEVMAAAAWNAGVRYFGVSCHSHTPIPADEGNVLPADMGPYREAVLALRQAYQGRMEVLLGLEWDSCADVSPAGFDYWIGSVHNLQDPDTGAYHCLDWNPAQLAACCVFMFGGDFLALAEGYYAAVAAMAAKKPPILGHIDLICKLNEGAAFFDEAHPRYRAAALAALEAVDPGATLLEINTGAVQRGYRKNPYPADFLLQAWREMGGRVIITSDAHNAGAVAYGYGRAIALAKAAGFTESVLLTQNGQIPCPL